MIATPDHQHCPMLVDAVRAGNDVYIEKPLATNMRELNDAVDAVKESGRVVQVGTQVRSWAPAVAARAFVASVPWADFQDSGSEWRSGRSPTPTFTSRVS